MPSTLYTALLRYFLFQNSYEYIILNCDFTSDVEDDADSAKMLRHLELIDGEASEYGVRIVKLDDALMAKKYGHRDPVNK